MDFRQRTWQVNTETVDALLNAVPDLRSKLVLSLILEADLRCTEVARLRLRDVDMERGYVTIRDRVHTYKATRPLPERTRTLMRQYVAEHPGITRGPLIPFS